MSGAVLRLTIFLANFSIYPAMLVQRDHANNFFRFFHYRRFHQTLYEKKISLSIRFHNLTS